MSWYAIVGPAGMPPAVVAKIQTDAATVIQLPEVRERLQGLGAEPVGSTPAEQLSAAAIKADYDRYGAVDQAARDQSGLPGAAAHRTPGYICFGGHCRLNSGK